MKPGNFPLSVRVPIHDIAHVTHKNDALRFDVIDDPLGVSLEYGIVHWVRAVRLGLRGRASVLLRIWNHHHAEGAFGSGKESGGPYEIRGN